MKTKAPTRSARAWPRLLVATLLGAAPLAAQHPDATLKQEALKSLRRAAAFYHDKAASHGGYVYYYSADLAQRWGEGRADADTIFVQPPGTPTVGLAFLRAFAATGDKFYLDAAREAAEALAYGQLQSGGWTQTVHFAGGKRVGKYRNGKGGSWNASSLDDGQTQSALRLLFEADRALGFKHAGIHDAAKYGLDALLAAQFPNGAFPQVWTGPVEKHPVVAAKFPAYDWKTEGRVKEYWSYYTLNDGLAGTVADTLISAQEIYKDAVSRAALARLGDFLLLAQMPEPQPGWCQQYNYEMIPIWARKFEPPAITGWESQDVMETLIKIFCHTGDKKYLAPIPRALAYYRKCLLPDGRIARYYEFGSNKPLYMDAAYQLTHDDTAAPQHYGWKQHARFDVIEKSYQDAAAGRAAVSAKPAPVEKDVRRILAELDAAGRWVSTYAGEGLVGQPKFASGFQYISSDVFSRNVSALSEHLAGGRK